MEMLPGHSYEIQRWDLSENIHHVKFVRLVRMGNSFFINCLDLSDDNKEINIAVDVISSFKELPRYKPLITELDDVDVDEFIQQSLAEDISIDEKNLVAGCIPNHMIDKITRRYANENKHQSIQALNIEHIDNIIQELQKNFDSVEIFELDAEDSNITRVEIKISNNT